MVAQVADWSSLADKLRSDLTPEALAALYAHLRLPLPSEPDSSLGYLPERSCWTRAERDGHGAITGVQLRFRNGAKPMMPGGRRGLVYSRDFTRRAVELGVVVITEGGSDQLACEAVDLPAVGRPSALDGVELLVELLNDIPADVDILVVGDNDENEAGERGARQTADSLAARLGRPVSWALAPEGAKDIREFVAARWKGGEGSGAAEIGPALLRLLREDGNRRSLAPADPAEAGTHGDSVPVVMIGTDEYRVNDEVAAALGAEPGMYQRGGVLVEVDIADSSGEGEAAIRRPAGSPVVRLVKPARLRELITRLVRFVRPKGEGGDAREVSAHPPAWCVNAIYERGNLPTVRCLDAVFAHPLLLADGRLIVGGGYDPGARVLVHQSAGLRISVPERPHRDDVAAARTALLDLVSDFPFHTDAHRAAWLAGLLSPLARFLHDGPSPLFLIDKNVRGAGAGLLADVIALVLTGRRFPVMAYTSDREELRKRITALAAEAERLVLLDNLAGAVGNDVLDMALTATHWKERLLGGNRLYDGPLDLCWYATGNNVQLLADTARRTCHIRLETPDEHPEERTGFRHPDLRGHVLANRGELLSAALTILRGWLVAGRPTHGLTPWGSFEGWSGVVREAVVYSGLPDPGDTRQALRQSADREAVNMTDIIAGLAHLDPGRRGMTASAVIDALVGQSGGEPEVLKAMREAVLELCGKLCSRTLGYKLRGFQRRTFGGQYVDKSGEANGSNRWVVRAV